MSERVPVGWLCIKDGSTAPAAITYTPACPKCGQAMKRIGVRR